MQDDCSEFPKYITVCTKEYRPVCGTNGRTYDNKCMFCFEKRKYGNTINIQHRGQCIEKVDCSKYPQPQKGMAADCPKDHQPVCGTDGKTYSHLCILCATIRKPFSFSSFFPVCIAAVIMVHANNCYGWQSHLAAALLTSRIGFAFESRYPHRAVEQLVIQD
uniref:Kazal-like domain-containing protein n=1 Tax=Naja naja TaxID=35670 RepID=A0A8C6V965_NAJNA